MSTTNLQKDAIDLQSEKQAGGCKCGGDCRACNSRFSTGAQIDHVVPGDRWEFDREVAGVFSNMLERSIPQYEVMRKACKSMILTAGLEPLDLILDLGCSNGLALFSLYEHFGGSMRYWGIDVSEPMLQAAQAQMTEYHKAVMHFSTFDLRQGFPECNPKVVLSILTLQFTPIEYRQRILADIYDALPVGGTFVLVEKILGATSVIDRKLVNTYYAMKRENGYTEEDIERKRLSLEGVLVPMTAKSNEELLRDTGFRHVDCFWRWMNFAGWVAVK